jgi:phenylacetic acid degradation operon negative regulatory protein
MIHMMNDVPNVLNQARPDDPRLLLSEPFRALHFVFGLMRPNGTVELSGRVVLGALAALGYGDEASRGILLRLRRGGFLESRRIGREAVYTLTPRSVALVDAMNRRVTEPPPPWDGAFETLLVAIPPDARAFREQLRRHAAYAGFGSPIPGLLIAAYSASVRQIEPLLASAPAGVDIVRGRLAVEAGKAARLAASAWPLAAESAAISREAAQMAAAAAAAEDDPPTGAAALALLWHHIGPLFALASERPPLPDELLPPDWPLGAAREAFARLAITVAGQAYAYLDGLGESALGD